jgi:hypothetical protein
LPPYPPVSELPAYPPAPDLTGYPPAQELPAYPSAPEGQAEAAAAQELPTFPPPPEGQPEASAALSGGDGGPRAAAGAAPVPERGAADGPAGRRAELLCERLLAYARALRLEPGQYLRLVLSVMEEGPTDLAAALDMLKARAGFGGPEGLLRLSSSFPEAAPRIRRSSMASEKF